MSLVQRYHMFIQARTDLTDEEIAKYEASATSISGPKKWPWRDTGEVIHARRRNTAKAFYRALRQIPRLIKLRADRINEDGPKQRNDAIAMRAWLRFNCLRGTIGGVEDEVKHFEVSDGLAACGLNFSECYWTVHGKPECDKCLAFAVERHPEMREFL